MAESAAHEARRRVLKSIIDNDAQTMTRAELEAEHGQVWSTEELQRDFVVESFLAPYVEVTRKSDGKRGLMLFSHHPRWYFRFESPDA